MQQITGDFKAKAEIFSSPTYCEHLGIQAKFGDVIFLNGQEIKLSYNGILELSDINIESLYFKEDTKDIIIDYI